MLVPDHAPRHVRLTCNHNFQQTAALDDGFRDLNYTIHAELGEYVCAGVGTDHEDNSPITKPGFVSDSPAPKRTLHPVWHRRACRVTERQNPTSYQNVLSSFTSCLAQDKFVPKESGQQRIAFGDDPCNSVVPLWLHPPSRMQHSIKRPGKWRLSRRETIHIHAESMR